MTAVVFGSLIQHQLIDYIPLGIAIRYVLDALREAPESNMFKFGLQALLRFQDRLPEWPQLGQALLALPHVQQSHPDIARMVRAAMSGQAPQQQQNGGGDGRELSAAPEEEKVPFTALNVDPILDAEEQREPAEDTSDRILFLLNTLSACPVDAQRWRLAQTAGATDALPCSAPRIWSTSRTRSRRSPRRTSTVGSRVGEPLHVLPPLGLQAIVGLPELAPFVSHRSAPLHNVLRDEVALPDPDDASDGA